MEMWSAKLTSSANCSDFLPNPDSRLTDLYWPESSPPRTSQRNRFLRFNDGVIQASLLRAAHLPEIDYKRWRIIYMACFKICAYLLENQPSNSLGLSRAVDCASAPRTTRSY